ncbi:Hypothetical predicted protein [Olea europaea subsp. europaea]|uniref:Uncharacterized protein n=1 Tax=Olea europaea subsp. europaea TaxID=158383 RepID=A0A8S0SQI4_OLEEU|nr:Hypothetical predicted protein [Olea europaea subsp. europaea]
MGCQFPSTRFYCRFLQGNEFTGSVTLLADHPLSDLNIEDNHFSGLIPESFMLYKNLWIGGNTFNNNGPKYPPRNFPFETCQTSRILLDGRRRKGWVSRSVLIIGGGTLIAACAALFLLIRIHRSHREILKSLGSSGGSTKSPPISLVREDGTHVSSFSSPPMITPSLLPSICSKMMKVSKRKSFSKNKISMGAKMYS